MHRKQSYSSGGKQKSERIYFNMHFKERDENEYYWDRLQDTNIHASM